MKQQANEQLTASMIEVIITALGQYHAFWSAFPFEANEDYDEDQLLIDLIATLDSGVHEDEYASSEVLYYNLSRTPNCKRIIDAISDTLITNRDDDGTVLLIVIPPSSPVPTDLIRFVDPWGKAIRYTYAVGDSFPVIESAGADGEFITTGDNVTSR